MSTCTAIESNPDVSGIGIRVNLYISMLLVAIIPETVHTIPLISVLVTNAGISGLALLITAMVQTAKGSLTLYHAIFIVHILFFTGVIVAPAGKHKGNTPAHLRRAIVFFLMTYGSVLLFIGYAVYIWVKAPIFGKNSECNDQIKYIIFFVSVRATVGWLRKLWMAFLGTTLAVLVGIPLAACLCCCFTLKFLGKGSSSVGESSGSHLRSGMDILIRVSIPLAAIYGVVMLELYEKQNQHLLTPGENDFTFGQIMALVQIISVFNEVFHFLLGGCTTVEEEEDEKRNKSIGSHLQQPNSTPSIMKGSSPGASENSSSEIQSVATAVAASNIPINSV